MLFDLVLLLCEKFPALSPFAVYRERFHDVMILFEDLKQNRIAEGGASESAQTMLIGGQVYTEAQNDDWY